MALPRVASYKRLNLSHPSRSKRAGLALRSDAAEHHQLLLLRTFGFTEYRPYCTVVIASRKEERLKNAVQEMCPDGNKLKAQVCNIRNESQVKHLISSTVKELGKIDYLVNNGGGQFPSGLSKMNFKGWTAVIDTNLNGTFHMCQEVYRQWMAENGGVIVNIIADMFRGIPCMAHTGAARAAVDNLTKSLSVEWAQDGVRVNAVAPGGNIYSPTAASNYGSMNAFEAVRDGIPMKRLGTPAEVSAMVCFLLSPAAAFITGATFRVDGGASLYAPLLWQIPEHEKFPAYSWTYTPSKEEEQKEKEETNRDSPKAKL